VSHALSIQPQALSVAAAELRSLKPSRQVYIQRDSVLFLTTREAAVAATQEALEAARARAQQQ